MIDLWKEHFSFFVHIFLILYWPGNFHINLAVNQRPIFGNHRLKRFESMKSINLFARNIVFLQVSFLHSIVKVYVTALNRTCISPVTVCEKNKVDLLKSIWVYLQLLKTKPILFLGNWSQGRPDVVGGREP